MRSARLTVWTAMLTAGIFALGAADARASAKGQVIAQRVGDGPFSPSFNAGGTPTNAHGRFKYGDYLGNTISGKVTCYFQEGSRAVFTGR